MAIPFIDVQAEDFHEAQQWCKDMGTRLPDNSASACATDYFTEYLPRHKVSPPAPAAWIYDVQIIETNIQAKTTQLDNTFHYVDITRKMSVVCQLY